jgi:choline-sulfatase
MLTVSQRLPYLIGGLVACLAVAVYSTRTERDLPPPPRHVVLISIDTLRADHLGAYGHPRAVTPHLDALAAQSVLFENHLSAAPTTLASHTALFTGNHPHNHGVPRNDYIVSDDNQMLPEILAAHGYQTAAFLGAIPLASHSGFTQGFEVLDEQFDLHRKSDGVAQTMRSGADVTDAVLAWVAGREDERPLFLFAHYFDVHSPYLPPPEHLAHYNADPSIEGAGSMKHISRTRTMLTRKAPQAKQHSDTLKERYLGGVTHADHQVGRLLDGLAAAGLLEDALIIVTSDHGEAFDAHEELWDHGETVFDETVHTPLIVRFPQQWGAGTRIPDVVSNVDVAPTLLELLGLPAPSADGSSLTPLLRGDALAHHRDPVYSEATKPHIKRQAGWQNAPMQKSVRVGRHKLVYDPNSDRMRLYDVEADPEELNDLSEQEPALTRQLRSQLDAWRWSGRPLPSERESSQRVQAELAALGYVAEDAPPAEGEQEEDPTPED